MSERACVWMRVRVRVRVRLYLIYYLITVCVTFRVHIALFKLHACITEGFGAL